MAKREAGWAAVGHVGRARELFDAWRDGSVLSLAELVLARDHAALIGNGRELERMNAAVREAACAAVASAAVKV